jgi:hypothetical protein
MGRKAEPAGLGVKALELWREIVGKFELRADERRALEDACRTVDLIERLQARLDVDPDYVPGSNGQEVANPLFAEVRLQRAQLVRQLQALHLPDAEDSPAARSAHGRALAAQRWKRAG